MNRHAVWVVWMGSVLVLAFATRTEATGNLCCYIHGPAGTTCINTPTIQACVNTPNGDSSEWGNFGCVNPAAGICQRVKAPVPAVSAWGVAGLALLVAVAATIQLRGASGNLVANS